MATTLTTATASKATRLLTGFAGVVASLSAACGSIKQTVSPQDEAVDNLNHQRYDDAIGILEDLHSQRPGDGKTSILLASAYVGSVGFDIIDAFDAFQPLLFQGVAPLGPGAGLADAATPVAADAAAAPSAAPDQLQELESATVKFLSELTTDFTTYAKIPHTPVADRRRLVQAILLLEAVDAHDAGYVEAKSYAALIGTLQFLNYTRDGMTDTIGKDTVTFLDALCAIKADSFLQNIDTSTNYLVSSLDDLAVAYKNQSKQLPANLGLLRDTAVHVKQVYDTEQNKISDASLVFTTVKASYCK